MFMLDNSGSTTGSNGTDPSCNERCGSIKTFLSTYGSNTNLSYSFSYFGDNATNWDMKNSRFVGSTPSTPFGNATGLSNALNNFDYTLSSGGTAYDQAFSALQNIIAADSGNTENYAILFMSDGEPNTINCDATGTPPPNQTVGCLATTAIKGLVQNLLQVASSGGVQATVSSVYFGPSDPEAAENLETMAAAGNGNFFDINQGQAIVVNDILKTTQCN
jgi:hypothetical protein